MEVSGTYCTYHIDPHQTRLIDVLKPEHNNGREKQKIAHKIQFTENQTLPFANKEKQRTY